MIRRAVAVLTISWVAIVGLACGIGVLLPDTGVPHVDHPTDEYFAEHRTAWLVPTMRAITTVGSPGWVLTAVAVVAVVLIVRRHFLDAAVLLVVAFGADAASQVVKNVVGRHRPPTSLRVVNVSARGLSFPSGHATVAAAGLGALAVLAAARATRSVIRTAALVAGVGAAVLVGLSRLYLGVHWPTDVLAGWVLAVSWMWAVTTAARPFVSPA